MNRFQILLHGIVVFSSVITSTMKFDLPFMDGLFIATSGSFMLAALLFFSASSQGHGLEKSYVIGMPHGVFLLYFSAFLIACTPFEIEYPEKYLSVMHAVGYTFLFGWIVGLFAWYRVGFQETYYLSEEDERERLTSRGKTPGYIDMRMRALRETHQLPPVDENTEE